MSLLKAPEIDINAWYPIGKAAKLIGINRCTLLSAAQKGRRNGGIDYKVGRNTRKKFSGKELLRFYNEM
ncbi:MAG: hypothetical protein NC095_06565 [Muribaculum sp.]|nr:hypothetical protein [Muribaculum sp.]